MPEFCVKSYNGVKNLLELKSDYEILKDILCFITVEITADEDKEGHYSVELKHVSVNEVETLIYAQAIKWGDYIQISVLEFFESSPNFYVII